MTGVLAQAGSFLHMLFGGSVAHAATESGEHASGGLHVVLKAEELFTVFGMPITNSLLMAWITIALLIAFAFMLRAKIALIPGRIQVAVEWLFEGVLGFMTEVLENEERARRFFPLIMTIFLFVFLANQLALLPGVGSLGITNDYGGLTPLLRAPAADLNMTLALAFISFFVIEVTGLAALGTWTYMSRYVNFSSPINFVVGIIEFLSNLGRIISFSFRLFGNIFAGEVMILVIIFFLPYIAPIPVFGFELFVAFIQAVVFSMLTLFFIKLAVMDPHESH